MGTKIDLHIHTNNSDGKYSPREIIDIAVRNGVSTISIADHDTIEAYTSDLYDYAKNNNINIINGVEISTKYNGIGVHVLGYNFDINNKLLKDKLYNLRNSRHKYLHDVSDKLTGLGYAVNTNELDKIDAVTKAHIAKDVINNKENSKILKDNFGEIPNMGTFIETIMNEGCIAYVKKEGINPKEASLLIKQAGGKVVLAHPVAYQNEDNLTNEDIKKLLKDMEADGLEANYIYVNRNNEKINDTHKWISFAKENNVFITIGSDFHSEDGIRPVIGFVNDDLNISDDDIELIIKNILDK